MGLRRRGGPAHGHGSLKNLVLFRAGAWHRVVRSRAWTGATAAARDPEERHAHSHRSPQCQGQGRLACVAQARRGLRAHGRHQHPDLRQPPRTHRRCRRPDVRGLRRRLAERHGGGVTASTSCWTKGAAGRRSRKWTKRLWCASLKLSAIAPGGRHGGSDGLAGAGRRAGRGAAPGDASDRDHLQRPASTRRRDLRCPNERARRRRPYWTRCGGLCFLAGQQRPCSQPSRRTTATAASAG